MIVVIGSWLASIRVQRTQQSVSSRWFALPAWVQIALGVAAIAMFIWLGFLLWIPLPLRLPDAVTTTLRVIGLTIYLVGLLLTLWARWALGAMYGVSTSSSAPLQEKHCLVQRGPYARIRHPMYLSYWLVLAALILVYRTWTPLILFVMTLASFSRRARREEAALAERFGAEWQVYAMRAAMFLPGIPRRYAVRKAERNRAVMRWQWVILLVGLGLYSFALIPGILPHSVDVVIIILSGVSLFSVAVLGFDTIHVEGSLAIQLIILSLLMLIAGIVLARQGHEYILLLLAVPALGLGVFGARKLLDGRKKT